MAPSCPSRAGLFDPSRIGRRYDTLAVDTDLKRHTTTTPPSELEDVDTEYSLPSEPRPEPEVDRTPSIRLQQSGLRQQSKRNTTAVTKSKRQNQCPKPTDMAATESRKKKQCPSPTDSAVTESKKQKRFPSPTDVAARLSNANSIRRFMTHVTIWRTSSVALPDFCITRDWVERAAKHYIPGDSLDNSSKLYKFLSLLAKVQVARSIDQRAADLGYERVPADMIEDAWVGGLLGTAAWCCAYHTFRASYLDHGPVSSKRGHTSSGKPDEPMWNLTMSRPRQGLGARQMARVN
ncbi:hypothetical protein PG991_009161 [Apiospora marii]|uniref:Uncharacterized protein n=1 Tax=Apiospora marii TaxID=335849 RepID=A0ABR1RKD7_9PEZI